MAILTILSLSINEHGIFSHSFVSLIFLAVSFYGSQVLLQVAACLCCSFSAGVGDVGHDDGALL